MIFNKEKGLENENEFEIRLLHLTQNESISTKI